MVSPLSSKPRVVPTDAHHLRIHPQAQSTIRSIASVKPLLDRVLLQRFKPAEKTASGLFLPSSATSSPLPEANVIATGPGALNKDGKVNPVSVKVGDKVLLPSWGGQSIKVGEEVSCRWISGSVAAAHELGWMWC